MQNKVEILMDKDPALRDANASVHTNESMLLTVEEEGKGLESIAFKAPDVISVAGDGNCVLRCFALKTYANVGLYEFLRKYLVILMNDYPGWFTPFCAGNYDDEINKISEDRAWYVMYTYCVQILLYFVYKYHNRLDHVHIYGLSKGLGLNAKIWDCNVSNVVEIKHKDSQEEIKMVYINNNHYNYVKNQKTLKRKLGALYVFYVYLGLHMRPHQITRLYIYI